jgi:hypothetical protein
MGDGGGEAGGVLAGVEGVVAGAPGYRLGLAGYAGGPAGVWGGLVQPEDSSRSSSGATSQSMD